MYKRIGRGISAFGERERSRRNPWHETSIPDFFFSFLYFFFLPASCIYVYLFWATFNVRIIIFLNSLFYACCWRQYIPHSRTFASKDKHMLSILETHNHFTFHEKSLLSLIFPFFSLSTHQALNFMPKKEDTHKKKICKTSSCLSGWNLLHF